MANRLIAHYGSRLRHPLTGGPLKPAFGLSGAEAPNHNQFRITANFSRTVQDPLRRACSERSEAARDITSQVAILIRNSGSRWSRRLCDYASDDSFSESALVPGSVMERRKEVRPRGPDVDAM